MAPRSEGSHLKRARVPGSPGDAEQDSFKKPRRSQRLSQRVDDNDGLKTPVQTKNQLPSPLTNLASEGTNEFSKEATATPSEGHPNQAARHQDDENYSQAFAFSSPPQDTQAFSQQHVDPNAPLSDEVEDEVKEGVWGYLFPLDTRHGGSCVVLRKRDTCPLPDTPSDAVSTATISKRGGRKGQRAPPKGQPKKTSSLPSGGYLIGRHPECDIPVDGGSISNRHCLLFTEHKGNDTVAILEDLSTNGTFVNDALVGRNQRRELKEYDEISLVDNKARFIFRYPKNRHANAFLQQYKLVDKLGKGHFAEVYLCIEKSTGRRYAVKVFTKTPGVEDRSKNEGLQQEIAMLMGVNHPNVLCLKDTFNEPNAVYLVLELAPGGELFNYIVEKTKLSESECRKLFTQLFEGVKYLHERNIVHRDIKPENILMVDKSLQTVKLADFGLAKIIGEESFTTTLCGTPSYVAPEILADSRKRKYTKAVDIWSLGVVLYICLCGFPPFSDELNTPEFPYSLSEQIRLGKFDYPSPYWDPIGDPALDLIDSMLVVDPGKRFTIDQCLAHPWMTQKEPGVNDSTNGLVSGLAGLEMSRRGVARERTLLSSINTVQIANRIPGGPQGPDIPIYNKNPGNPAATAPRKEARPDEQRDPNEFMALGGKGDQELYGNDTGSHYPTNDIAEKASASKAKGKPKKSGR
ncbi:putative serine/threonine-protein kinase fhkC [Madurella mycetomatis]|uniref:Serine/threonine-protein kinase fhkC n=1 Tax=Madurella mycetomatis TaxID=100816 RepID=A0A175W346_9PEZI|nr:putative serine/threonine-protein kinase fhkC [Madurella mycetomatis]